MEVSTLYPDCRKIYEVIVNDDELIAKKRFAMLERPGSCFLTGKQYEYFTLLLFFNIICSIVKKLAVSCFALPGNGSLSQITTYQGKLSYLDDETY